MLFQASSNCIRPTEKDKMRYVRMSQSVEGGVGGGGGGLSFSNDEIDTYLIWKHY